MLKMNLQGSNINVITVDGFPHGFHKTETKVFKAKESIKDGAAELNAAINIEKLISTDFKYVENDVKTVVNMAHNSSVIVKVILETCF